MVIAFPNPIPAEAGMCAIRVFVPETPEEVDRIARTPNPAWPLYRVTIWKQQRAFFAYWQGEALLLGPESFLMLRGIHPGHWAELTPAK